MLSYAVCGHFFFVLPAENSLVICESKVFLFKHKPVVHLLSQGPAGYQLSLMKMMCRLIVVQFLTTYLLLGVRCEFMRNLVSILAVNYVAKFKLTDFVIEVVQSYPCYVFS